MMIMKLKRVILPLIALAFMGIASNSNADVICAYDDDNKYELTEAIERYGDVEGFVEFCCKSLPVCHKGYFSGKTGERPTHAAAKMGHTKALEYLVKSGVPHDGLKVNLYNGHDVEGTTPLIMAVDPNNKKIKKDPRYLTVKYLLKMGINGERNRKIRDFLKNNPNNYDSTLVALLENYFKNYAHATMQKVRKNLESIREFGINAGEYNYAINSNTLPTDMFKFDFSILKDWNILTLSSSNAVKARA
jgi:hypothetical protein